VRFAPCWARNYQVASFTSPPGITEACSETALTITSAILWAHIFSLNATVFAPKPWLTEAFANLAKTMATAFIRTHILSQSYNFARCSTVSWFADTFPIDTQPSVTACVWSSWAGLLSFAKFTTETRVTKAFLVEA